MGPQRSFPPGTTGLDIARSISPSLAKRTAAMVRDGGRGRPRRPHRGRRPNRVHHAGRCAGAGAHPPRRGPCPRRSGADALARHAGDDRAGDRRRLLLRLLQAPSRSRPRISRRSRPRCARSSRATRPSRKTVKSREAARAWFRGQGRGLQGGARRCHPGGAGFKILQPGGMERPLPGSAHDLDGQDRPRLQAHEGGRRLLARRQHQTHAVAHLWHGLRQAGGAGRAPQADRGGAEARSPPPRPGDGPVSFPGGGARRHLLASQGMDAVPDAGRLYAPPPRGRLPGGERPPR